ASTCERVVSCLFIFFFQAEDGIRDSSVTGVQTCALPIFQRKFPRRQPFSLILSANPLHVIAAPPRQARVSVSARQPRHRPGGPRSEERRVGKECRSRWSRDE